MSGSSDEAALEPWEIEQIQALNDYIAAVLDLDAGLHLILGGGLPRQVGTDDP